MKYSDSQEFLEDLETKLIDQAEQIWCRQSVLTSFLPVHLCLNVSFQNRIHLGLVAGSLLLEPTHLSFANTASFSFSGYSRVSLPSGNDPSKKSKNSCH